MALKEVVFGNSLEGILEGRALRGSAIITHGAGKGMDSPLLVKTGEGLAKLGFRVLRFNFGYLNRKSAPSKDGVKERPELEQAIEYLKNETDSNPLLVGKSFGARVNSYVSATRSDIRALVFYGMPIQGLGKNPKPRDFSHLSRIAVPMLFITGHKDRLCPLELLEEAQENAKSSLVTSVVVPGDHSYKPKSEDLAVEECLAWVGKLD